MSDLAGWSETIKRIGEDSRLKELADAAQFREDMIDMLAHDREQSADILLNTYVWAINGSYGMNPMARAKAQYADAVRAIILERMN